MTPGEEAGWEYLRVVVNDLPITQREVASQFEVTEGTVRTNYKKILRDNGMTNFLQITAIKQLLRRHNR